MPVEIRELIIRAVVNETGEKRELASDQDHKSDIDTEAIIEECVRRVLKTLKKSRER